jgi:transposase
VLTLPPTVRIFLAPGATDMRNSFDGLAAAARRLVREDPLSGHVFVFCNRRRHILKILCWDGSGFWVFSKRLEKGTFFWPVSADRVEMRSEELALLLGGIDLRGAKRRRWYDRRPIPVAG